MWQTSVMVDFSFNRYDFTHLQQCIAVPLEVSDYVGYTGYKKTRATPHTGPVFQSATELPHFVQGVKVVWVCF